MSNQFGVNARWVVSEVREVNGQVTLFMEPETLKLKPGFNGEIIWHLFTPGYELVNVQFPAGSGLNVHPQPDPNRERCFHTVASNNNSSRESEQFPYTITVKDVASGQTFSFDPVVESEAPPP